MKTTNVIYQLKKETLEQKLIEERLIKNQIHPVMAKLYALRDTEDIDMSIKLEPFSNLLNIKEAVVMLAHAIEQQQRICIVADYDVDGATACSIGLLGLRMFGANIDYVVPDRFIHGYGLTPSVVDEAIQKKNPDLIITVDNGIASFEGIDYAHEKGIKVLVTDHHLQGETLPNADCIVNPNQNACNFNSKALAGCGVMFYVLCALRAYLLHIGKYSLKTVPNIFTLLDLVAIGTVSDLVKLDINNRLLVKMGLDQIRRNMTRPGILALIEVANRTPEKLSTSDIGFAIGPRINAAGRLEDMTIGINCLLSDDIAQAREYAEKLNSINQDRKMIESEMKEQALELPSLKNDGFTSVAYDPNFHEGVIGIVASRIKEIFYRPTIVFTNTLDNNNLIKGSGRSIAEVHLRDALDYVHKKDPNIIAKFGGHAMAAGLTIYKEKFEDFCTLFEESVEHFTQGKNILNIKEVDMELQASEINFDLAILIQNEVWGQGFLPPLFQGNFKILEQLLLKETHLKLKLQKDDLIIDAIWFFKTEIINEDFIDLAYSLSINEFRGMANLQLLIDGEIK